MLTGKNTAGICVFILFLTHLIVCWVAKIMIRIFFSWQVEEMNNDEVELCTLPYVLALHAFCVVDPTLCAPASDPSQFVVTLQPYLKSQVI